MAQPRIDQRSTEDEHNRYNEHQTYRPMSKILRVLHKQLKDQGYTLLTALNAAYEPGCIVHEKSWKSLPLLGRLSSELKDSFPEIQGPRKVVLEGFTRTHDLEVNAAFEWLGTDIQAKGQLKNVVQVKGQFEGPISRWVDLLSLSTAVAEHIAKKPKGTVASFLNRGRHRLVAQIIEARLSFHFEKDGGVGANVNGTIPESSIKIAAGAGYKWKNEATIESIEPVVVAVQLADWRKGRNMFVADL